jgi:cytosine permease
MEVAVAHAQARTLSDLINDNALNSVPEDQRKPGWYLSWLPAGVATSLLQLTIAGTISTLVGSAWGLIAGGLVGAFALVLGWLFSNIAYAEGMSSTVLPRFYGLGVRGSAISSLAFAIMIITLCASENVLLYNGTLFAAGWHDTVGLRILIYGGLSVAWVLLSMFGIKTVARTATVLVIAFVGLLAYMVFVVHQDSGVPLSAAFSYAGSTLEGGSFSSRLVTVIGLLGGQAGALILVNADYCRYARSRKAAGGVNLTGAIMLDVVGILMGILVLIGGNSLVARYLVSHHMATEANAISQATVLAGTNTGAYFVVLSTMAGFLLMYVAQAKVQVLNVYSGSLALSNLWYSLTGRKPGRLSMIIATNVICLVLIALNVFGKLATVVSDLGIVVIGFIALSIADYYIVRRRAGDKRDAGVERVNWAGVLTLVFASVLAYILQTTGVFSFGFVAATIIVLVVYPPVRTKVFKPGWGTSHEEIAVAAQSLSEEAV